MKVIKPPQPILPLKNKAVFLAGSIEMGKAVNWQQYLITELRGEDVTIWNPRRDDWDISQEQSISNAYFVEQVEWELRALEFADIIALYFAPNTKSPISLLEFGLHTKSGRLIVCCPKGFWRKGNVDVVCRRYGVTQVNTINNLLEKIKMRLKDG